MCEGLSLCVCESLTGDAPETIEVIIIGMVRTSDMVMHHVLIILSLTFIQGHTILNDDNNKCSIISENVQAIPIKFAVKIARLKGENNNNYIIPQSDDLAFHSRSELRLKLDNCLTCTTSGQYLSYGIQAWHAGRLIMHGTSAHVHFDDLDLDARS